MRNNFKRGLCFGVLFQIVVMTLYTIAQGVAKTITFDNLLMSAVEIIFVGLIYTAWITCKDVVFKKR